MNPLLFVQYRVVSPETIFIETTKTDSALCIYIFVPRYLYNNNEQYKRLSTEE